MVGVAPDGSKLYAAEWQREPTDAELAFYLRKARYAGPSAYGLIACRTAPRFKVEDCRPIGESPGSGMGYAVNEAAWQFHVKPPRVNGDYQVGTWVSIRIMITPPGESGADTAASAPAIQRQIITRSNGRNRFASRPCPNRR